MKQKKGFTLIELLVVVGIIGVLSGIVLVSINGARNKGKNGAIKAEMAQLRSAGELYTEDHNTFTGWCLDSEMTKISQGAISAGGTAFDCDDSSGEWAAKINLVGSGSWCVDANGTSKSGTKGASATVCP